MQCQGVTNNGSQCSRKASFGSNYCWQHQNQLKDRRIESTEGKYDSSILNYNLNEDVELLMYSYLPLEEVLTIFRNDIPTRDKIIGSYFKELPNIDDASAKGNLETVKYLYEKGIKPTSDSINYASMNGHLNVIKYLYKNGVELSSEAINFASSGGHLNIIKFLHEDSDVPLPFESIDWASEFGYLDIVKYLYENGIKPTKYAIDSARTHGHLDVVKYLSKNRFRQTSNGIDLSGVNIGQVYIKGSRTKKS